MNSSTASLYVQVTVFLITGLFEGLELALQPRQLRCSRTVTLHKESGWPEENDCSSSNPRGLVTVLYAGDFGGTP